MSNVLQALAVVLAIAFAAMTVMSFVAADLSLSWLAAFDRWLTAREHGPVPKVGSDLLAMGGTTSPTIYDKNINLPKTWAQQIQFQAFRDTTEQDVWDHGGVVSPVPCPSEWFAQSLELKIDAPLLACAGTFATLAQKEVMISSGVARKRIVLTTERVSAERALESFHSVLKREGIAVIPLTERTLALVQEQDLHSQN